MEHLKNNRPQEAEDCFRKLLNARPSHAAAHHFMGAALLQLGHAEAARKEMRRSLELLPGQRQWIENLLKVEERLGNSDEVQALQQKLTRSQNRADKANPTETV
jgi:Flp pilus assembly protein TadD